MILFLEIWFAASLLIGGLWALAGLSLARAGASKRRDRARRLESPARRSDVSHPSECVSLGT